MSEKKDWLNDSDRNIFLTGKAGTGKTYTIKQFVEREKEKGRVVLVSATTGTAAVTVGGETAHSLFGIPVPCMGVPVTKAPASQIKVLSKADTVIIDEVSMMRNDSFAFAIKVLKKAEKEKGGKIRVVVTGDFSQLPPVVPKSDEKLLTKFGFDTSGYPFTTKEWQALNFKVVELTKIYRQEDLEFTEMLGQIRDCNPNALDYFNQFVDESYAIDAPAEMELESEEDSFSSPEEDFFDDGYLSPEDLEKELSEDYEDELEGSKEDLPVNPKLLEGEAIVLCGTNAEADKINRAYLEAIPCSFSAYKAKTKGSVPMGVVEDVVLLKNGSRVMFTVNDTKNRYQNGTFGTVVKCLRDHVVVQMDNEKYIAVYPEEYTSYNYKVKGGVLVKDKVGTASQIPLKVAAAVTIHKSQGKTFEKAIVSPSVFAAGQLYVALSRVKSPEGLILTAPIQLSALVENEMVSEFYRNGFTYKVKEKKAAKTAASKSKSSSASSAVKKATVTKKETSSKTSSSKTTKKTTAKKTPSKTTSAKKVAKTPVKKTTTSKKAATKSSVKKPSSKASSKTTAKKTTAKKASSATKKPSAKKSTTTAKKTAKK